MKKQNSKDFKCEKMISVKEIKVQRKELIIEANQMADKIINFIGEFDPGSGRTLAACLTHASRTEILDEACDSSILVADG